MKFLNMRTSIAFAALMLGLGFSVPAKAVDTQTITATLNAVGVLDVVAVTQMNFGSWYFAGAAPTTDEITLVKATTGGITPTAAGGSTAIVVGTPNTTPAQLTVAITGGGAAQNGTVVHMTVTAPTLFADTDATLLNLTYRTATQVGENAITADGATTHNVTIVAGATPEPVFFGGTITVTGGLTGANTSTFDATFAY